MEKKKYVPGEEVEKAQAQLNAHKGSRPGAYVPQWQQEADTVLGEISSRKPFHYDAAGDPVYRQAVDQYVRLGRKAMMDTMGKAAGLTGGYGNSYAQGAGQQTYGEYLEALAAKLPQFQEMALKRYEAGGRALKDRYEMLTGREKQDYDRYQKALEQYLTREDRLRDLYDRERDRDYDRYVSGRDYDYALDRDRRETEARAERDRKDQERWERDREYQAGRDKIRDEQWERQFAENKRRYELEWAAKHASGGGSGGGGGYGGAGINRRKFDDKHGMKESEFEKKKEEAQKNGHYNPRPAGKPWSPGNLRPRLPHYSQDLTW